MDPDRRRRRSSSAGWPLSSPRASRASTGRSTRPHVDCGDNIVVINADKVVFTGDKHERQDLLPAHRLSRRHQGDARRARSSTASSPSASSRRPSSACSKRGPLQRQLMRNLQGLQGRASIRTRPRTRRRSTSRSSTARTRGSKIHGAGNKDSRRPRRAQGRRARRPTPRPDTCRSSTSSAAPTPPASARTRSRASGSSPARA